MTNVDISMTDTTLVGGNPVDPPSIGRVVIVIAGAILTRL